SRRRHETRSRLSKAGMLPEGNEPAEHAPHKTNPYIVLSRRVPLARPVFSPIRSLRENQHWQSQWHTQP
ncbi:MAG: hypothetical protein ACKVHE_35330, partial [Planctomycetales bacterium]